MDIDRLIDAAAYVRDDMGADLGDDDATYAAVEAIAGVLDAAQTLDPDRVADAVAALADAILGVKADDELTERVRKEVDAAHTITIEKADGGGYTHRWACTCVRHGQATTLVVVAQTAGRAHVDEEYRAALAQARGELAPAPA